MTDEKPVTAKDNLDAILHYQRVRDINYTVSVFDMLAKRNSGHVVDLGPPFGESIILYPQDENGAQVLLYDALKEAGCTGAIYSIDLQDWASRDVGIDDRAPWIQESKQRVKKALEDIDLGDMDSKTAARALFDRLWKFSLGKGTPDTRHHHITQASKECAVVIPAAARQDLRPGLKKLCDELTEKCVKESRGLPELTKTLKPHLHPGDYRKVLDGVAAVLGLKIAPNGVTAGNFETATEASKVGKGGRGRR